MISINQHEKLGRSCPMSSVPCWLVLDFDESRRGGFSGWWESPLNSQTSDISGVTGYGMMFIELNHTFCCAHEYEKSSDIVNDEFANNR